VKSQSLSPVQKFLNIESSSGILLFGATILALIWANTPFSDVYHSIWNQKMGIKIGEFELIKPVFLWINDGLMAVFFFLIGLEIKREVLIGELNSLKKASFPLVAAIGGMVLPVLMFFIFNNNHVTQAGWGIPMATDIAFSLAILQLLGNRVPLGLKVFLMAFAIVDDLGAVMVIAIFYSGQLNFTMIIIALLILALLFVFTYFKKYSKYIYFIAGIIVWFLFLKSGIHPTIAGVLVAFTIPINRKIDERIYTQKLSEINHQFSALADDQPMTLSKEQIECIDELESWTEQFQSPLQHLEHKLHNWVAYVIMPIFAFANAGITLKGNTAFEWNLVTTIIIALVIGKLLGISLFTYIGLKMKWIELPDFVYFKQIIGVAFLAGVGFTMSIFVANLAFYEPIFIDSSKLGILIASIVAGILGYFVLKFTFTKNFKD